MVCLKEVFLAYRLHKQGKKAPEIRQAIIKGDWEKEPLQ